MASLQASSFLLSSSSCSSKQIRTALSVPKIPSIKFSVPKVLQTKGLSLDLNTRDQIEKNVIRTPLVKETSSVSMSTIQLYAVLESIADRVEMHNVGQQRENWNSLLLNSINMITLTAATMAGLTATGGGGVSIRLQLASTLLFSAATGMLVMVNKIQPSQLVEEQRNATRLFKQLKREIETLLAIGSPSKEDVEDAMEKVLSLDEAYPLPLMGVMLEKFPETLEPAVWWPKIQSKKTNKAKHFSGNVISNGWNKELDGTSISGPLLTGIAAIGSAFMGSSNGSYAAIVAAVAGALASTVNTFEHGDQVGVRDV